MILWIGNQLEEREELVSKPDRIRLRFLEFSYRIEAHIGEYFSVLFLSFYGLSGPF